MAALQQLRRKAAIVEGPGVGQVLPVTRLSPKQSHSVCSALVGAAPGTVTKAPFSWDWSWMQLPGEPHMLPWPQRWQCRAPLSPAPRHAGTDGCGFSLGKRRLGVVGVAGVAHPQQRGTVPGAAVKVLHKHQSGWLPHGDKVCPWAEPPPRSLPPAELCRGAQWYPSSSPVVPWFQPSHIPVPGQLYPSSIPAPSPSTARGTSTLGTKDLQQGEEGSAPAGGSWIGAEPTAGPAPAKPVAEKFPSFLLAPAKGT